MPLVEMPSLGELRNAVVLSLDLGRRTGWACFKGGLEPLMDSGVFELYATGAVVVEFEPEQRFSALYDFLGKMHQATSFTHLAFEMVTFGQKGAQAQTWPGYRAIVMLFAQRMGIRVIPLHTGTIKKAFTGNGAAKKEQMLSVARQRGYLPFDDNECDAIGVLHTLGDLAKDSTAYAAALEFAKRYEGLEEFKLRAKAKPAKTKKPKPHRAPRALVAAAAKKRARNGARNEQKA